MFEFLEKIWDAINDFFSPSTPEPVQRCSDKTKKCGPYKNSDQAAKAALNYSNPLSIRDNLEYGGLIYKDKDGGYYYSGPVIGDEDGVNPFDAEIPKDAELVGDYHTHADYSVFDAKENKPVRTSDPARDDYDSDNFSTTDYSGIKTDAEGRSEYKGYLGTPSGTFKYYDPDSGTERTLK